MDNTYIQKEITWKKGINTIYAGSPIDENGKVVNNSTAIGIVAEDLRSPDRVAKVLTAGEWDETLHRNSGIIIRNSVKKKLSNIKFKYGPYSLDDRIDAHQLDKRVISLLEDFPISGMSVETVGIPCYVGDVTDADYAEFELEGSGWYVFARIISKDGVIGNTDDINVTGAAGIVAEAGNDYIDVAVKFEVAAQSKPVTIDWGESQETIIFRATDLGLRNLDYRSTFYVYDISPYATWQYGLTTDAAFKANKPYFTLEDGEYVPAEVTAEEAVPAYYTLADETYTQATGTFQDGVTYYTKSGETYTEAEVTAGEDIPAFYAHSKLIFSGMIRNVTYKLDETVDCPIEIELPVVPSDGYGAWFEIQMRYDGSYSTTLIPPAGAEVKIGTAQTQAQTEGINTIDLQYTEVDNIKLWTLLNTHSTIPQAT